MALDDQKPGVERLLFLRSLAMVRPEGPEAQQIAAAMRDVYFRRAAQLFGVGDPSGDVFFLVKGSVRMAPPPGTVAPPWDFEAPAIVGALDSFLGRPRTRSAVATSETHALALAAADWLAVMEDNADFARESMLRLSGMLLRMHLEIEGDGGYAPPSATGAAIATGLGFLEKTIALREVPPLRAAGVQVVVRLVELATEIDLGPGDALFREGEACDAVDVVASGVIEIERSAPPLGAAFGPGALVGGAGALGLVRYPFGARARDGAAVIRLRRDDVLDMMEDHFELTRALMSAVNAERGELMGRHGLLDAGSPASSVGRRF
jgi:CRP-like cAMP-binding protein